MKKIISPVLAALLLCATLFGCSAGNKYKLISVPDDLQINTETLSENAENLLDYSEDYPLFLADAENGVFVYACNNQGSDGVLVKFDGRIQYFPWRIIPSLADPDIHVYDYNGDGLSDIAITVISDIGETNYNEDLHILMNQKRSLEDCLYSHETGATDRSGIFKFSKNTAKENSYFFFIHGQRQEIELKNKGNFFGLYFDAVQDFTLGDKITVEVVPGLSFETNSIPDYSIAKFHADVNYENGVFSLANPTVDY